MLVSVWLTMNRSRVVGDGRAEVDDKWGVERVIAGKYIY